MKYIPPSPGVDVNAPLIYMWEIRDASGAVTGRYIGKANGGEHRPTTHYPRNVDKLLRGLPYKKGKDYRRVHYSLANAVLSGHAISLSYLCNVPEDQDIFAVEMHYIRQYRCNADDGVGLNGPRKGQFSTVAEIHARPTVATPPSTEIDPPDLADFIAYVKLAYPGQFEARAGADRYSLWIDGTRILRARQQSPTGKVWIKLVQSTRKKKVNIEMAWDGSDEQLAQVIDGELALFR